MTPARMTARMIDADQLLAFIAFLNALDPRFVTEPGYTDREWALKQIWAYVTALVEQPTLREIEESLVEPEQVAS